MGRAAKSPPQLGHTPCSRVSTHVRQKVHSKVQIIASVDSGGRSAPQHSQLGRSSSMGPHIASILGSSPTGRFTELVARHRRCASAAPPWLGQDAVHPRGQPRATSVSY